MPFADVPRLSASITITSPNLTNDSLALTSTGALNKAGTSTPLDQTSGVGRRTYTAASIATLFAAADYDDAKNHKVYIRNASTTATEYALVSCMLVISASSLGMEPLTSRLPLVLLPQ